MTDTIAPTSASPRMVLAFSEIGENDHGLVGGKAHSLGSLARAGFAVPEGFVLTTHALARMLLLPVLAEAVAAVEANLKGGGAIDEAKLAIVREQIVGAPLPSDVREALTAMATDTFKRGTPLAVRSSGTKEDLEGASFAGQYETLLNVRGEIALEVAVKKCWASLWQARVLDYARKKAGGATGLTIAVVVQRMVPADVAGVLFTVNPLTGREEETMIEAAFGLGESLVSGRVNADRFLVDPISGRVKNREIAHKAMRIDSAKEGSTREVELSEEEGSKPTLNDTELAKLAKVGADIQEHYGRPMDVEWALSEGTLYVLQARPITHLTFAPEIGEWTTADFKDGGVSSDVCSPLMWSLYDLAFEHSMPAYLKDIKLLDRDDRTTWARMFFARPYWNFGAVKKVLEKIPGFVERSFDTDLGIDPTYEGQGKTTATTVRGVVGALPVLFALKKRYKSTLEDDKRYAAAFAKKKAPYDLDEHALAALDRDTFAKRFRALVEGFYFETETAYFTTIYNTSNSKLDFKVTFDKANKAYGGNLSYLSLVSGLQDLSHLRPSRDLHAVLADLTKRGASVDDETVRSYAQRWKHHGQKELDIRVPRWHGDLPFVRAMMEQGLESFGKGANPEVQARSQHAAYLEEVAKAKRALRLRPDVWFSFARQLELVRSFAWWREEMRDYSSYLYYLVRLWTVAAGERLVAQGRIETEDDVFYLPFQDLLALVDTSLSAVEARRRIKAGRRLVRSFRNFENPNEVGSQYRAGAEVIFDGAELLRGTGCSHGKATATARVIKRIDEMHRVEPGDILVTKFTDPGWTPLFARLGGVVTETGGVLAHAAVISREYGIPAVLAIPGATVKIGDGDLLAIDGSAGTVQIVKRAGA